MNLKKFALRALAVMAVVVALCMFFSGTIQTITTAKIKITRSKAGRLEEKTELSGKLVFPDAEAVRFALDAGQSLQILRVNARPGYAIDAGEAVIEAQVADYDSAMKTQQESYDAALDQLLMLESKNAGLRLRRSDEIYAEAYFELRARQKQLLADRIAMEALLAQEKQSLPEAGFPENASETLIAAISAYRKSLQAQEAAQTAFDGVERYLPDDAVWTYISSKHEFEEKMAAAEQQMQALSQLNARAHAISAPHEGYLVEMAVKAGDTYDGSADLFTISREGAAPVLRMEIASLDQSVAEGMAVIMASERNGNLETKVLETGLDSEGKRYADVELNDQIIAAAGGVYAMSITETPLTLVNRAKAETTLLSANAVHGTGADRYIFTVETSYSSFGNSKMTVHKMNVTVLAEADGMVSIAEDLNYCDIAYMEDRPISDGDTVMLYIE